ncbi:MAG: T9SS type A sorting domain-containing protein [Ignavibacteriales bacterium]|nr:T9SS type A sorting domain-containing protein [Ignavibacteriales bacterium]
MKKWVLAIVIFIVEIAIAQQTTTTGNLLRLNFTKNEIDYSDTLWQWTRISYSYGGINDYFHGSFTLGETDYVLSFKYEVRKEIEWRYNYLYNNTTKSNIQLIKMLHWIDVMDPIHYEKPIVVKKSNGAWLFFSWMRRALYVRNDSLYESSEENNMKMIHFAGKVGNKDLVVLESNITHQRELFLTDLSKAPSIKYETKVETWENGRLRNGNALKIHRLNDSLYVYLPQRSSLYLTSFFNNKFNFLEQIRSETYDSTKMDFREWFFNGNIFYSVDNRILYKEIFDLNTKNLKNKTALINLSNLNFTYDLDSNYIAYHKNDSLFVYSINQEKHVFVKSIKSIKGLILCMISAPYVYYLQTKTVTDVKKENLPTDFVLYQNYPNPFNPATVISYQLAVSSYVTLKIYDLLGREVETLVSEFQQPGQYVKTFHGTSLPSGIYFYTLRAGDYIETKKMVLTK